MSATRTRNVTQSELFRGFTGHGSMQRFINEKNWSKAALFMEANDKKLTEAQKALWEDFKRTKKSH